MRKANSHSREISFVSSKDGLLKMVTNDHERRFTKMLESDENVARYYCSVSLENWTERISVSGIRKAYRELDWLTSVLVEYSDGTKTAYEVVCQYSLEKKADIEKLEISRRYWSAVGIKRWKLLIVKGA